MDEMLSTVKTLDWQRVVARRMFGPQVLHDMRAEVVEDVIYGGLVASLETGLLTESAGATVSNTRTAHFALTRKVRPRWIPRRVWDRLADETVTDSYPLHLMVEPKWSYPSSSIVVPDLGRPVSIAIPRDLGGPESATRRTA